VVHEPLFAWKGHPTVLLIVMYQAQTWRVRPSETFTFGRAPTCTAFLAEDHGLSRTAGSFRFQHDAWWVRNDSRSSLLYLSGDLGFRVDLPPGMQVPLQQWHIKIRLQGVHGDYTLRLRLPDLDDVQDLPGEADGDSDSDPEETQVSDDQTSPTSVETSTHRPPRLSDDDRLVLAARFEEYLTWRHVGEPAPRSAAETAARIGWQSHTVIKRCENIRNRCIRGGAPGLRGPRALEELARLLMSTGVLTADDLRRLPPASGSG
jgi:hypothetical protein